MNIHARSYLLCVPLEIIFVIPEKCDSDTTSIARLAQTCHRFYAITPKFLYKHLVLGNTQAKPFRRTIKSNPSVAKLVKSLTVHYHYVEPDNPADFRPRFLEAFVPTIRHLSELETLTLKGCGPDSPHADKASRRHHKRLYLSAYGKLHNLFRKSITSGLLRKLKTRRLCSSSVRLSHTMATDLDQAQLQDLIRDSPSWYKSPSLIKLYLLLVAPLLTSTAWGFDNSLTNGLQSVNAFMQNFGHPSGSRLGFFGAAASVGGIVACIIGGPLTERFGRRSMCLIGAALVVAMAFMETYATSFEMFTGSKILLGFGAFFQQITAPVLVTELAHPKERVAITSIYNTSIFLGLVIGSWVTFGTYKIESNWSWKIPCLLQIAIPAYQAFMIWFCPESPRWLVSKGRIEEARAILIKYHGNGVENEIVRYEMQEIIAGIEADNTVLKFSGFQSIKDTFSRKGNLIRLWLCMATAVGSQSIGGGFITSYLPLILDQISMTTEKEKPS